MFTGIIEEVGKVVKIEQRGENRRITVHAANTPKELGTGHSVAVSGVCLTALDMKPNSFCADLAPEPWIRTSFSRIHEGALVNLELPMKADGRFGGHIVQGHVDGVGKLIELERIVDSDGRDSEMTNLGSLKPGDPVNLEADLIAKYVEKMMKGDSTQSAITVEELVDQGF